MFDDIGSRLGLVYRFWKFRKDIEVVGVFCLLCINVIFLNKVEKLLFLNFS